MPSKEVPYSHFHSAKGKQTITHSGEDHGILPCSLGCRGVSEWLSESHSVVSDSLQPHRLYSPWNSLGQITGVGSLSHLPNPGIELRPGLLQCRWILYQLSHKGSPGILERVTCPFSRGSSWPRNWTGISCIAGRFFTNSAIGEAPRCPGDNSKYKCWEYESNDWDYKSDVENMSPF